VHTTDRPELEDIVRRMRGVLDEYPERVMVGELYLTLERLMCYYDYGCHLPFNFQLIELPWDARIMDAAIRRYEEMLPPGAWPNWVLGNHDRHRIASRVGGEQARVAAMLLLTLRGTPTLYYGDELGMTDVPIPPEQVQDPWELRVPGLGLGRDPERTPMQWDASPNAGFTSGAPWLPVAADFRDINVDVQQRDPASLLCLHRRLLALRRAEPALSVGSYEPVEATGSVLAYVREAANQRFLVALNLNSAPASLNLSEWKGGVVLGTHSDREGDRITRAVPLRAHEGIVAKLD
jgi:alpha-glucosidase